MEGPRASWREERRPRAGLAKERVARGAPAGANADAHASRVAHRARRGSMLECMLAADPTESLWQS